MTVAGASAPVHPAIDHGVSSGGVTSRRQILGVVTFAGLSLGLAGVALVAGVPAALLPFVLAVGPTIIALGLAWHEGHGALRRLARSVTIRPRRSIWYLALTIPVFWSLATVAVAILLGEPTVGLFDTLVPALFIIPLVVLLPAFAEEIAWRGFALPRLMSGMAALPAALVLAIPWTAIHVALFLPGQWYAELAIWPMVVSIVSYSILLTWVFVGTGGSVLMTALFHAGLNGLAPVMAGIDADASWVIRNVLAAAIAIGVVALGGFRRPSQPDRSSRDARDPAAA